VTSPGGRCIHEGRWNNLARAPVAQRVRLQRFLLLAVLLFGSIGCDQVTKSIATRTMAKRPALSLFHDVVRLQHTENTGAFLSLGADLPESARFWFLTIANLALCGGLLIVLVTRWRMSRAQFIGLALVAGGGIGNLIDRVTNDGRVVDFLNVGLGSLRTGIFNVADVAIMAGALALLLAKRVRTSPD
jgi:signal peptidase II